MHTGGSLERERARNKNAPVPKMADESVSSLSESFNRSSRLITDIYGCVTRIDKCTRRRNDVADHSKTTGSFGKLVNDAQICGPIAVTENVHTSCSFPDCFHFSLCCTRSILDRTPTMYILPSLHVNSCLDIGLYSQENAHENRRSIRQRTESLCTTIIASRFNATSAAAVESSAIKKLSSRMAIMNT